MTQQEAADMKARLGTNDRCARALRIRRSTFGHILAGRLTSDVPVPVVEAAHTTGGIRITPDTRMTDRKPSTTLRARFYGLAQGKAYPTDELAREWAVTADSVKRHAQEVGCFAYIETAPETWTACAMHPDTAKIHIARQ